MIIPLDGTNRVISLVITGYTTSRKFEEKKTCGGGALIS
jgi:hypothetical protein